MIPTEQENPDGLNQRYNITKANGDPCDPRAVYFVLRLDSYGDDPEHIEACRRAAKTYYENAPGHMEQVAFELFRLTRKLMKVPFENPRLSE